MENFAKVLSFLVKQKKLITFCTG